MGRCVIVARAPKQGTDKQLPAAVRKHLGFFMHIAGKKLNPVSGSQEGGEHHYRSRRIEPPAARKHGVRVPDRVAPGIAPWGDPVRNQHTLERLGVVRGPG